MINLLKHFNNSRILSESALFYHSASNPRWTSGEYESVSEECFLKNVIAFRAINLISRGIASIPMNIRSASGKTLNGKLADILKRPNQHQSRGAFFETLVNYLLISGNGFVHCDDEQNLSCLRSDRVQIVPNRSKTGVDFFVYNIDSSQFRIEKEDLLHIKFFHPLDDWYGLSPLQVASRSVDQHNAMSEHNVAILQNGGRPSGCLLLKSGFGALSEEQREQLRDDMRNAYSGTVNAGKIMVLEGDFEWKEMGLSPKDLDFSGGKDLTTREIAQAFGVPPVLVGLRGDSGFANYREARLHLWEDTILPLAELIRLELNNWLTKKFKSDAEIIFDLDKVHALTSRRDILWQKVSDANFLTLNEKRELLGFPPLEGTKLSELSDKNRKEK